jgi:hypothetical protein
MANSSCSLNMMSDEFYTPINSSNAFPDPWLSFVILWPSPAKPPPVEPPTFYEAGPEMEKPYAALIGFCCCSYIYLLWWADILSLKWRGFIRKELKCIA